MDCLQCKVCDVPYNEEGNQPRYAPCGHELCIACLKVLIKDGIFVCPTCRKKNEVGVPENLPVCFGLIEVIREFKTKNISLTKETGPGISRASNDEICKVHHKAIGHRCLKCQLWICEECLDVHSTLMGCSTISSSYAMNCMKLEHSEEIKTILTKFKHDANYVLSQIQEHTNKKKEYIEMSKKHGREVEKLHQLLEQGKIHKDKLVESGNHLNATNSPFSLMDKIEMLTQRKLLLRSWSAKNIEQKKNHNENLVESDNHLNTETSPSSPMSLLKVLKEGKSVYTEMIINNEKRHAKLSHQGENIYYHYFQPKKAAGASSYMHLDFSQLQKLIPKEPSLVFLVLSLDDVEQGHVHVRLDKDLPNIRAYMVQLFTGQCGSSLAGKVFTDCDDDAITAGYLPFKDIPGTPDNSGSNTAKQGDVVGYFSCGSFEEISFFIAKPSAIYDYGSDVYRVFGQIETGLDVIQHCYNNYIDDHNVKIIDCGLVIEQE